MDSYETLATLLKLIADAPACAARLEQIKAAEQRAEAAEARLVKERAAFDSRQQEIAAQLAVLEERRGKVAQEEASLRRFNNEIGERVRAITQADDRLKRAVLHAVGIADYDHALKTLPDWPEIARVVSSADDPHYGPAPAAETVNVRPEYSPATSTLTRSMPSAAARRRQRLASDARLGEE
jgi:flagellar biosynthesis/type III secretory pathway chaperone